MTCNNTFYQYWPCYARYIHKSNKNTQTILLELPLTGTNTVTDMTHALTQVQEAHTTLKKEANQKQPGWLVCCTIISYHS